MLFIAVIPLTRKHVSVARQKLRGVDAKISFIAYAIQLVANFAVHEVRKRSWNIPLIFSERLFSFAEARIAVRKTAITS